MSHIFDALQRSEEERSGADSGTLEVPTELLRIAEAAAAIPISLGTPVRTAKPEMPAPQAPEALQDPADSSDLWRQFESLPISLPPYSKLVSATDKNSLAAEKFRYLAVRLRHLRQRRPIRRLVITSTVPEEGKSTVAANLACALAARRQPRTLLLEGDLRRPVLGRQLGLGPVDGLSEYLQGGAGRTIPIYRIDSLGIWILPAGSVAHNPLELLQSDRLSQLMEQLNGLFEWIVIDTPPVLPLGDTSVWMRLADGILLIARQGTTDRRQLQRGLEAIESGKLLGALLNGSTNALHSNYYYQRYGQLSPTNEAAEKMPVPRGIGNQKPDQNGPNEITRASQGKNTKGA